MIKTKDINEHPLLDSDQAKLCKTFAKIAKQKREPFDMLQFSEVCLRATARDYAIAREHDNSLPVHSDALVIADLDHKRAAILWVYEALKACKAEIVSESLDLAPALDLLYWLKTSGDL